MIPEIQRAAGNGSCQSPHCQWQRLPKLAPHPVIAKRCKGGIPGPVHFAEGGVSVSAAEVGLEPRVCVGCGVGLGSGLVNTKGAKTASVGEGARVACGLGEAPAGVAMCVGLAAPVELGVRVKLAVGLWLGVGVPLAVKLGISVSVGVWLAVRLGVNVSVGVSLGVNVSVGV